MDSFMVHDSPKGMHSLCTRWQVLSLSALDAPSLGDDISNAGSAASSTLLISVRIAACPPQSRHRRGTMAHKAEYHPQWLARNELHLSRVVALLEAFLARNQAAFRILSLRRAYNLEDTLNLQESESLWWTVTVEPTPSATVLSGARVILHIQWIFLAWHQTDADRPLKRRKIASHEPPTPNPSLNGSSLFQLATDILAPDLEALLSRSLCKLSVKCWVHPLLRSRLHATWVRRSDESAWALGRLAHHLSGWTDACIGPSRLACKHVSSQSAEDLVEKTRDENDSPPPCSSEEVLFALLSRLDQAYVSVDAVNRPTLDMQDFAQTSHCSSDELLDPVSSDSPWTSSPVLSLPRPIGTNAIYSWATSSEYGPLGLDIGSEDLSSAPSEPFGLDDVGSPASQPIGLAHVSSSSSRKDGMAVTDSAPSQLIGLADIESGSGSESNYGAVYVPLMPSSEALESTWQPPTDTSKAQEYASHFPSSPPWVD